jgi:hypothetical protein
MALGSTQPLKEMSTRNLPGCKGRPARKADNLTAICEPTVYGTCGSLDVSQPYRPPWSVAAIALLFSLFLPFLYSSWSQWPRGLRNEMSSPARTHGIVGSRLLEIYSAGVSGGMWRITALLGFSEFWEKKNSRDYFSSGRISWLNIPSFLLCVSEFVFSFDIFV